MSCPKTFVNIVRRGHERILGRAHEATGPFPHAHFFDVASQEQLHTVHPPFLLMLTMETIACCHSQIQSSEVHLTNRS